MKLKNANWLFIPVLLLAVACKKNDISSVANDSMRTQVTAWIDKQQSPEQTKRTAIVKGIKENLEWDKAWNAKRGDDETIVMIPIGKGYTFMNNKDKNVDNYLVLFKKTTGEIKGAHIFQSLRGSSFSQKTIPGYYNSQPQDMNGTYWVLALHDIIYTELKYENNRLKEGGMPQAKTAANNRSNVTCVDWFWVHTVYDAETGWIISQTETYLGTTCTGCLPNTNQPQTTITAETEWDCMAGTSGSEECSTSDAMSSNTKISSTITRDEYEIGGEKLREKTYMWDFARNSGGLYPWHYISIEKGVHKKVGNEWQWKSIEHVTEIKEVLGPVFGFELNLTSFTTLNKSVGIYYAGIEHAWTIKQTLICRGAPFYTETGNKSSAIFSVDE